MSLFFRTSVASLIVIFLGAMAPAIGCGSGAQPGGFGGNSQSDGGGPPPRDGASDVPHLNFDSSHGKLTALTINPPTSKITVANPAKPPTSQLKAVAQYSDGSSAPVAASWTLDRVDIAGIGAGTGLVTPTG